MLLCWGECLYAKVPIAVRYDARRAVQAADEGLNQPLRALRLSASRLVLSHLALSHLALSRFRPGR